MMKNTGLFALISVSILTTIVIYQQCPNNFSIRKIIINPTSKAVSTTIEIGSATTDSNTCPNGTILYNEFDAGNTGNQIWAYLSVLGVYKLFPEKFVPYVQDNIIYFLEEIFEPLSIPPLSNLPFKCKEFKSIVIQWSDMYPVIANLPNDIRIVRLARFSTRREDVIQYGLDKVRQELKFKPDIVKVAMDTLYELRRNFSIPLDANPVYVGMQFRGTDYTTYITTYFKGKFRGAPTHEFYSRAMKYFTDKYEHVIFILISIDYEWIEENAQQLKGNVAVNPYKGSKVKDMALLSHCNHSIINYGTFGTTTAMLAGGTTIVYDLKVDLDHDAPTLAMAFTKLVDSWILMD